MYTGEYLDSLENGVGMITYSNGDVIDANFLDGMIEGHGVLKYTNGDQREGFFNMNKLDGQVRTNNDMFNVSRKRVEFMFSYWFCQFAI